jgi:hypothetical protein
MCSQNAVKILLIFGKKWRIKEHASHSILIQLDFFLENFTPYLDGLNVNNTPAASKLHAFLYKSPHFLGKISTRF